MESVPHLCRTFVTDATLPTARSELFRLDRLVLDKREGTGARQLQRELYAPAQTNVTPLGAVNMNAGQVGLTEMPDLLLHVQACITFA